jgi:hypothetical protein
MPVYPGALCPSQASSQAVPHRPARHAIVHQLFDGFIEVLSYRFREFVVTATTGEALSERSQSVFLFLAQRLGGIDPGDS